MSAGGVVGGVRNGFESIISTIFSPKKPFMKYDDDGKVSKLMF